jgi:hypothetical protein
MQQCNSLFTRVLRRRHHHNLLRALFISKWLRKSCFAHAIFWATVQHLWHIRQARLTTHKTSYATAQTHVAALARKQAPHRRVDEVAHAGHKHPRHKRLDHQQKQAAINGELLSHVTNLVRAEIDETIGVNACRYASKIEKSVISEISQQPNLQKYSASTLPIYICIYIYSARQREHLPKGASALMRTNEGSSRAVCTCKKSALPKRLQQPRKDTYRICTLGVY